MDRLSYKTLFLVVVFLLIPIVLLTRIRQKPSAVLAEWWNDSWMYRQAINISSHTAAESNVYITTSINIGSTAKAQGDDGDFRFTDQQGNLLSYYISSGAGTANITFHVQFASFPVGAQTIYAYYGNPSATNGFSSSDFSTGASNYSIGSVSAEETGGAPVAWWKFDEGVGTTAFDSSSGQNHGVFGAGSSAPAWTTEDQCISGKCLNFSGNDYISVNNESAFFNNTSFSVSSWVRFNDNSSTDNPLFTIGTSSTDRWLHLLRRNNTLILGFYNDDLVGSATLAPNTWYLVTFTWDATTLSQKIFINGSLDNNRNSTGSLNVPAGSTLFLGKYANYYLNGILDDIKIYPYARTAAQIKQDYASGSSGQTTSEGSNVAFGSSSQKGLSDGLVGYWKFDEGVGTTTTDSSGSSFTGTFGTGDSSPGWAAGKFGIGISFPGTQTYVEGPISNLPTTGNGTFSFWAKGTGGAISFLISGSNDSYLNIYPGSNIGLSSAWKTWASDTTGVAQNANSWNHYVFVVNTANQTLYLNNNPIWTAARTNNPASPTKFRFGNRFYDNRAFNGTIDEVRIYNRALSSNEVTQLYNYAPGPVGYWKFEEGSGTTAYNTAGNGSNATLQNGAGFGPGKYGQALSLNIGSTTNQYASFTSIVHNYGFTKEAWIKPIDITQCQGGRCSVIAPYFEIISSLQYYDYSLTSPGWHTGGSIPLNQWSHIAASYDKTNIKLFINGVQVYSLATGSTDSHYSNYIGALASNNRNFRGYIDEVKIYNYARTQSQILEDMGTGTGSKEPIIWYKFDESQGTVANNSGIGGTLNGAITNGSWSPTGKINKSLTFAANTSVTATITNPGDNNSVSLWLNPSTSAASKTLVTASKLTTDSSSRPVYGNCTGTALNLNQWTHLVAVSDGTASCKIFQNGIITASSSVGVTLGTSINIGAASFTGLIDEVKIYNFALSADEVKKDYNRGSTAQVGQTNQTIGGTTTNLDYCLPGDTSPCSPPVAEYKFEEGVGTTAYDSSGNNKHGVFGPGTSAPAWISGKIGKGLSFDGSKTYLSTPAQTGIKAISLWIKPSSASQRIIDFDNGTHYLSLSSGILSANGFTQPKIYVNSIGTSIVSSNFWQHITITTETGFDGSSITIGKSGTNFFSGQLDQVRIYNYARTPAQVAYDYNKGGPVGWWKLDECQGNIANDSSGVGNTGAISIGASGTQTAAGTCQTASTAWGNGASGKNNSSLKFDGSDDEITNTDSFIPNGANPRSFSFWLKPNGLQQKVILGHGVVNNLQLFSIIIGSSGKAGIWWNSNDPDSNFSHTFYTPNQWNHITFSYDGSNIYSYVNGVLKDIVAVTLNTVRDGTFRIGNAPAPAWASYMKYLNGQIDDVRVYNYPLTSAQVQQLYNGGALNFR